MKHKHIYLSILVLAFASLACSVFIGGPDYPPNPVPVSTEASGNFIEQMQQAMTLSADTGTFSIQVDETQLTSYLANKLQEQTNPPFTDPQVLLRDGQMQLFGKITRGYFVANMAVVHSVGVDENGLPKMEVVSADFGPFPAPEGLNSAISAVVEEAFTGTFGPAATGLRIENITIADGTMTLTGRVK